MRVFKHPVSLLLKFKFGEMHENFKTSPINRDHCTNSFSMF
jgi:hypothetical protein